MYNTAAPIGRALALTQQTVDSLRQKLVQRLRDQNRSHSDLEKNKLSIQQQVNDTLTATQEQIDYLEWCQALSHWPHLALLPIPMSSESGSEVTAIQAAIACSQYHLTQEMISYFHETFSDPLVLFGAILCLLDTPLRSMHVQQRVQDASCSGIETSSYAGDEKEAVRYDILGKLLSHASSSASFKAGCGQRALCCAARHGNWKAVQLILESGVNPNSTDQRGWGALHYAVGPSSTSDGAAAQRTCDVILSWGGNLELRTLPQGNTPLLTAAWSAKPGMLRWLIARGGDVSALNDRGSGVLHSIVSYNAVTASDFFQDCALFPQANLNSARYIPASEQDMADCIAACFSQTSYPIDVNQSNAHGTVPLLWAAMSRQVQVMQMLCNAGAEGSLGDRNGTTALHALASTSPTPCTLQARSHAQGCLEVHLHDQASTTSSVCTVCSDFRASCQIAVRILVEHGANMNCCVGPSRVSPLMNAAASGNYAVAAELLRLGADPTLTSLGASTALHYCCNRPQAQNSADVRRWPGYGPSDSTDHCTFIGELKAATARALLQHPQCAPNARDSSGFTPILMSAWSGQPAILRLLLEHPAVSSSVTVQGWNLYHIIGMQRASGPDAELAACVATLHRHCPPVQGSTFECVTNCWHRLTHGTPNPVSILDTVSTASGLRTPLSLAAECLRPLTVAAMLRCGAVDTHMRHSIGQPSALHLAFVGKRSILASTRTGRPAGEFAPGLHASFRRSSMLSANAVQEPHIDHMISLWNVVSVKDEQAMQQLLLLFMRRGGDVFHKLHFYWPDAQHSSVRRKLSWCIFDYLVAGGLKSCLETLHREVVWCPRRAMLFSRLASRQLRVPGKK